MDSLLLAGDVGGTKTIIAAFDARRGAMAPVAQAAYESRRYDGLDAILREFLGELGTRTRGATFRHATFSVAGPVVGGRALLTNLGWHLDPERLGESFGLASVLLVNDLQATAYAIPHLTPDRLHTLQAGHPEPDGVRAVLAPGTGLGEAFLVRDAGRFVAWPSEGGNANFAPADETQLEMLRFLRERIGYVGYEEVCSGLGIPNVYRFLKETGAEREPAWLAERLAAAGDPTPVIADAALERPADCGICVRTMELFVEILGSEAGNMALRLLPTGGVYVGGGIPPRILPLLRDGRFMRAFADKGRFVELMAAFPVHVILDPRAALVGATEYSRSRADLNAGPPMPSFPP